jgi:hypothetical protein
MVTPDSGRVTTSPDRVEPTSPGRRRIPLPPPRNRLGPNRISGGPPPARLGPHRIRDRPIRMSGGSPAIPAGTITLPPGAGANSRAALDALDTVPAIPLGPGASGGDPSAVRLARSEWPSALARRRQAIRHFRHARAESGAPRSESGATRFELGVTRSMQVETLPGLGGTRSEPAGARPRLGAAPSNREEGAAASGRMCAASPDTRSVPGMTESNSAERRSRLDARRSVPVCRRR